MVCTGVSLSAHFRDVARNGPRRGFLGQKVAKGGGFEGAEALQICALTSFHWNFGKNDQ